MNRAVWLIEWAGRNFGCRVWRHVEQAGVGWGGQRIHGGPEVFIANAQSKCDVGTNLPAIGEEVGLAEQSWVIRSVAEVTSRSAGAGEIVNEICELAEYLAACIAGSVVQLATESGRGELLGALVE